MARIVVGLVLLAGAGMKGYDWYVNPVPRPGFFGSREFQIGLIDFEVVLGLWMLLGVYRVASRRCAIATLVLYSGYSGLLAVRGDTSCGCFGSLSINPWHTMIFDLCLLTALLRRPQRVASNDRPADISFAGGAIVAVALAVAIVLLGRKPTPIGSEGQVVAAANAPVVLDPSSWLGKQLPVRDHIDVGAQLGLGKWTILFYHFDCPKCRDAVRRLERSAREAGSDPRVAVIAVPPYAPAGRDILSATPGCLYGQLSQQHRWLMTTPVEVSVRDGFVTGIR